MGRPPIYAKFRNKPTEHNGRRFASKKEAAFAATLDARVKLGEVSFYLPQVPIPLPGAGKYVVDFVVFQRDGLVRFVDVKGVETPMFKLKRKQIEAVYPFEIEVI
jgi:hypothetical protein